VTQLPASLLSSESSLLVYIEVSLFYACESAGGSGAHSLAIAEAYPPLSIVHQPLSWLDLH